MFNVRHLILVISFPHFPRCNHHHCSNGEANGVIPSRIVDLLHINEIAFHRKRWLKMALRLFFFGRIGNPSLFFHFCFLFLLTFNLRGIGHFRQWLIKGAYLLRWSQHNYQQYIYIYFISCFSIYLSNTSQVSRWTQHMVSISKRKLY